LKNKENQVPHTEAERKLKAVIDTVIDGILTIDERGTVETMNPAAGKLFGYDVEEIIGQNIKVLMPQPFRKEHDGYLARYQKTNEPRIIGIGREVKGMRKDGSIFPLRLAVSEVKLDNRRIYTGIIHDLSNVKEAEQRILALNHALEKQNEDLDNIVRERTEKLANVVGQLLQTNNRLEGEIKERHRIEVALLENEKELKEALEKEKELSELKSRFVSIASHEFRTPLSTVLSSIELIEAYKKEEQHSKREKHINRIKNSVNFLNSVLNDFLSLSKLENGTIETNPEEFILRDFCFEVVEALKPLLKPGQRLIHNDDLGEEKVFLDKKSLRHILFNLVSNAIKYSRENQLIECHAALYPDELKITIKDSGIGIPKEEQKYLFTRFFRARNVENIQGTGLGLNIVRRYVDILNGEIRFKSEIGEGTTFWIQIPLNRHS
jgi:PAS domain S-box-containing protein